MYISLSEDLEFSATWLQLAIGCKNLELEPVSAELTTLG